MKAISSLLISIALFLFLVATLTAQNNTATKQNPSLLADELPGRLVIVFAPGTTITEANHLRLDLDLTLQPTAYHITQTFGGQTVTINFHYAYPDDSQYTAFERFFYARRPCSPCPPITPARAYYEPVTAAVAELIEASPIVQSFDNRPKGFFLRNLLQQMINEVRAILFTRPTG